MSLPPDRFCNMVYVYLASRQESEQDLAKLDSQLAEPFPWERKKALRPEDWHTDDDSWEIAARALGQVV